MKVGFISLGCSKNLVDSERVMGLLKHNGFEFTNHPQDADVIVCASDLMAIGAKTAMKEMQIERPCCGSVR